MCRDSDRVPVHEVRTGSGSDRVPVNLVKQGVKKYV
jgi:hypothetical protein